VQINQTYLVFVTNQSGANQGITGTFPSASAWNHLVVSVRTGGKASLYMNGVCQLQTGSVALPAAASGLTFGGWLSAVLPYAGSLDNLLILDGYAVNPAEAAGLYNSPFSLFGMAAASLGVSSRAMWVQSSATAVYSLASAQGELTRRIWAIGGAAQARETRGIYVVESGQARQTRGLVARSSAQARETRGVVGEASAQARLTRLQVVLASAQSRLTRILSPVLASGQARLTRGAVGLVSGSARQTRGAVGVTGAEGRLTRLQRFLASVQAILSNVTPTRLWRVFTGSKPAPGAQVFTGSRPAPGQAVFVDNNTDVEE
jgi:hypothetical protein